MDDCKVSSPFTELCDRHHHNQHWSIAVTTEGSPARFSCPLWALLPRPSTEGAITWPGTPEQCWGQARPRHACLTPGPRGSTRLSQLRVLLALGVRGSFMRPRMCLSIPRLSSVCVFLIDWILWMLFLHLSKRSHGFCFLFYWCMVACWLFLDVGRSLHS